MTPGTMFDVTGKEALITGAPGAVGMVAARVLAGAGCRLVLAAGKTSELAEIAAECEGLGAAVLQVNLRPSDEAACADLVGRIAAAWGCRGRFESPTPLAG